MINGIKPPTITCDVVGCISQSPLQLLAFKGGERTRYSLPFGWTIFQRMTERHGFVSVHVCSFHNNEVTSLEAK